MKWIDVKTRIGRPLRTGMPHRSLRRGTVLLMVVALLGALFVLGASLLSTVTFETQTLGSAEAARTESRVIDALSNDVRKALRAGAVGNDGKPWNRDFAAGGGTSNIGNDISGEIPGVHPLIASVEPYDSVGGLAGPWVYYNTSDLEATVTDTVVANTGTLAVDTILDSADSNGDMIPDETAEWDSMAGPIPVRRDADGDGVWDSYLFKLPEDRYPLSMRGEMQSKMRALGNDPNGVLLDSDLPDEMYYALRVLPHGAMVNVNYAHETLLEGLFTLTNTEYQNLMGPYAPEAEESTLRNRFLLPPKNQPRSSLQDYDEDFGVIPKALYEVFVSDWDRFQNGTEPHRWWPIDTGMDGQDDDIMAGVLDNVVGGDEGDWLTWIADPTASTYDLRHLLTTVSYDDQFMRIGREPSNPQQDWIDAIHAVDDPAGADAGLYRIDEWPTADQNVDARSRQKVSLPGIVNVAIKNREPVPPAFGGPYVNRELDALPIAFFGTNSDVAAYEQLLFTIQEAFLLMLRNVRDIDGDSFPDLPPDDDLEAYIAASLTANLIDFADDDGAIVDVGADDLPTWVAEIRADGTIFDADGDTEPDNYVYGVERQPFITEVYMYSDQSAANMADEVRVGIELYNPYSTPINLASYHLVDATVGQTSLALNRVTSPLSGAGSILANDYMVIIAIGSIHMSPMAHGGGQLTYSFGVGGDWGVDPNSVIELRRTVPDPRDPAGLSTIDIVVDRFNLTGTTIGADVYGGIDIVNEETAERDSSNWRFVVPLFGARNNAAVDGFGHTLGDMNVYADSTIRPVHIDTANTSRFDTAIPTTGTMLLLSRFAHEAIIPVTGAPSFTPFNAWLVSNARMVSDPTVIDNGRMPIFDQSQLADQTPGNFSLGIPWGQLVFDYFTALPLMHRRTGQTDMVPEIDSGGTRVHGRIDINTAPWIVLAGLPLAPRDAFPLSYQDKIKTALFDDVHPYDDQPEKDVTPSNPIGIGASLAQAIVAYRESRQLQIGGAQTGDFGDGSRLRGNAAAPPEFTGFLTVGELANVRHAGAFDRFYRIDGGSLDPAFMDTEHFVRAAAVMIALGDWVTTRSDVFTVYGTVRGAGTKSLVDQKAVRFHETVDRMPSMFSNELPKRVGRREVGPYMDSGN